MNRIFGRIKEHLRKERLNTASNIIVITITFLLLGFFIYVVALSQTAIKELEGQAQITIFFEDAFTEDKILDYKSRLENDPRIVQVDYVSKEQALEIFKEINKDEPILLESVSASILPASLELKTRDLSELSILSEEYQTAEGVEEIRFFKDVVERFKVWSTSAYIIGFILVALFLLISFSVVVSTLRTTINQKGPELEIMKLVGATDSYVRKPFLYHGMFLGLISSVIASTMMLIFGVVLNGINVFPKGISFAFIGNFYLNPIIFSGFLSIVLIASGLLLGFLGSNSAVKKYLKY